MVGEVESLKENDIFLTFTSSQPRLRLGVSCYLAPVRSLSLILNFQPLALPSCHYNTRTYTRTETHTNFYNFSIGINDDYIKAISSFQSTKSIKKYLHFRQQPKQT